MPIVLDPNKSFVNIIIYFVEEKKKHGNSVFHFINSAEQMEEWKAKGYRTREELAQQAVQIQSTTATPNTPPSLVQNAIKPPVTTSNKIIEVMNTTWKRMTWKEQNAIFSQSLRIIGNESEIDALKYRELKLKTCLKKWDAKDEDGNLIPLTSDTIDNMCPEVASELLKAFERVTEPSEEDLKN